MTTRTHARGGSGSAPRALLPGVAAFASVFAQLVAATLATGGCDRGAAPRGAAVEDHAEPFVLAGSNLVAGSLPAGEDLVLRFTRPIDVRAFGPRSVVITSPRRRRLTGSAVRVTHDSLRIPGDRLRGLAPGEPLVLRVEGGASPCSLRATDGAPLGSRLVVSFRCSGVGTDDLTGPSLVASRPADGDEEVAPGAVIELRFDEPLGAAPLDDAITVRESGRPLPARLRASADRRRVFIHPAWSPAPGSMVEVVVHRSLADATGNLLDRSSRARVRFRVRRDPVREVEEDFSSDEFLDPTVTDCAWGEQDAPGVLVPRCGTTPLPCLTSEVTTDLGARDEIRFQILIHADETTGGFGSSLRLRLTHVDDGAVRSVRVEGGPIDDDHLDPWLQGNRDRARLELLADAEGPLDWEPAGPGTAVVDIPFVQPLSLERGVPILLDVTVTPEPGVRLAAATDAAGRALVRGAGRERLIPAVELRVAGAEPTARSTWYDSGDPAPLWRPASVEIADDVPGARVIAEFQTAPSDARGRPDVTLASAWDADLGLVPAGRFVRFRLRFDGAAADGRMPRVDRVVMPYDAR